MEEATKTARQVISWATERKIELLLGESAAKAVGHGVGVTPSELVRHAEVIVALGGDGTFLGVARLVGANGPLMVGVNYGELGFLTEIAPAEIITTLNQVIAQEAKVGERALLIGEVWRDGKCAFSEQALNDVVVEKGSRERLLGVNLAVGGEEVMNIRADGIIFSTPTGSTAYSLSAGGSIVYPSLRAVLVTPICPHSLTSRPLVLPLDGDELTLHIPQFNGDIFISFDGQISEPVGSGDVIRVKRAGHSVRYVQSPTRSYYGILRTKLNWGLGNRRD